MRLRMVLALVISLTVSIGIVAYSSYVAHHQSLRLEQDVRREALTLTDSAAASLPYALLTFNLSEVEDRVSRFAQFPGLIGVRVANAQGEVLAGIEDGGRINTHVAVGTPPRYLQNLTKTSPSITRYPTFLRVRQAVTLKSFTAGWVELDYSLKHFEEDKKEAWQTSLIVGAVLLLVINVMLMAMLERPLRALERLTRFAAELGQEPGKTVSETAPVREVADLQLALNSASIRLDQQQQAIVAGSLRLQLLLDNAGDAVLVTDEHGNICLFNPAAERLFGWSTYEALGFTLQRLLPELENDVPAASSKETWGLRHDGRPLELELSVSVIDEDNSQKRIFVARDITARKELEHQWIRAKELAESANIAKSDFLANMSHEIRTPMNGILGMTEMLLDTKLSYEQRDYLFLMKSSADALLQIINDILDFSKIESSRLTMEAVEFDPRALARGAMHTLALRAAEKNLELILDVADDVPAFLIGDPLRLRQVLINLLGNAIKFTYEGEVELVMRVSQTESAPLIYFGVRDTGIGVAPQNQTAIFEAFTQADTSTTRQFGGTGLGLAISHRLVSMMGGQLIVRSQEGMGSLFFFTIPLPIGPSEETVLPPQQMSILRGQPVLIVDDNFTSRRLLQSDANQWGMLTKTAPDGETALAVLHNWPPEQALPLVIVDGYMPDMDGFAFAERLRREALWADIKVVMLSPSHRKGDQSRANQLNLAAYLLKPVEKHELALALIRALTGEIAIPEEPQGRFAALAGKRSLSILAAEDNVVNQRLIVGMLEKLGHKVRLAFDGQEAIQQYEKGTFDLILMDVQMPVLGGLEATQKIRLLEIDSETHIPIVAMTANAMPGDRAKCIEAGMDDYLAKPLHLDELAAILNRIAGIPLNAEIENPVNMAESEVVAPAISTEVVMNAPIQLDSHTAIERMGGDPSMYRMLIEMYLDDQANQIKSLFSSFAAHDGKTFERAAHSVKGLMASLGAEPAREFAWKLEQAGRADNWDYVSEELNKMIEMMNAVEHQLREWLCANP